MRMISRQIICVVSTCCLVLGLCGCSGGDDSEVAAGQAGSSVDPTRASARALFDHIESICNREHPDAEAYYALVHTETPKQKVWIDFVNNALLPRARFAKACFEKFGEYPPIGQAGVWQIAEATWKKEEPDRVEIECINDHGVKSPLHLVRLGDQWWISGYTFEYAKHIGFNEPGFDRMTESLPGIGPHVDRVTARVRNGEFATLEEAEEAQSDAIGEYSKDHPRPRP
jgi:hypothetical protein